jgi:lysyl-tRNA synthetase class II
LDAASSSTRLRALRRAQGLIQPTIVHDYPVELSPFARPTDGDPTLTERFEYFAAGW